jgi:hypothetical protein
VSAHSFLAAMTAEMERLAESQEAKDASFMRAIKVIADAYTSDIKRQLVRKTPERERWLRANYATWPGLKRDVLTEVNTLPGAPLTIVDLSNWAYSMKLKRDGAIRSKINARKMPKGKDGAFSMSALDESNAAGAMDECPVTLADALEWGRRNGMHRSGSIAEDLRATNAIRIGNGLPAFTLIADKPTQRPLPRLITHQVADERRH